MHRIDKNEAQNHFWQIALEMFATHIDYDKILREIRELKALDKDIQSALVNFVTRLKKAESDLNVTISQEFEENEAEL